MKVHGATARLSAGHFFVDTYSSMFGAFLPFLHRELNLTLTEAGLLGGALIVSGSLMQPIYGYLSDRFQHRAFAALGPAIAGIFISSLGMAGGFSALLGLIVLGGVGIASFHPQGTAVASSVSSVRPGFQLSVFLSCGIIGYSLGPLFITYVIETFGLRNSYLAAIPGILVSIYLMRRGPSPTPLQRTGRNREMLLQMRQKRGALIVLFLLVVIRSAVQLVFVAFLPLLLTLRGFTEWQGSECLALFLFLGGVGGFLGGSLTDWVSGKSVIVVSTILYVPLLLGFLMTDGPLSVVLCGLGGGALLVTTPVNVAMAQRLIPQGAGTVSALMMGFAWGVGGAAVPAVGRLSDQIGLESSLTGLMFFAASAILLSFLLPSRSSTRALLDRSCGEQVQKSS